MTTATMTNGHQTSALALRRSQALRLPHSSVVRCLSVTAGRVWLTRSGAGPDGDDVWLSAGERMLLPADTEWVAEGWPEARLEVAAKARPARSWLSAWRTSWPKLRAAS